MKPYHKNAIPVRETVFTVRVKPYKDELLSSFMLRLSKENGMSLFSLWNMIRIKKNKYAQMSNIYFLNHTPLNLIDYNKLSRMTDMNPESILQMTLYYLLKRFNLKDNLDRSRFLIGMVRNNFYFCPVCLNQKPYHRQSWRINGMNVCVEHGGKLYNHCPSCRKTIKYSELSDIVSCPHCDYNLAQVSDLLLIDEKELKTQKWLAETLDFLFKANDSKVEPIEISQKILYILNDFQIDFNREAVLNELDEPKHYPTLLQYVRNTISKKRMLHLSSVFSVLMKKGISFSAFLNLDIPKEFIDSVKIKNYQQKENSSCKAPWCSNFNLNDSLIKVATGGSRKNNGDCISYYLVCPKCFSEYSYSNEGKLYNRTINFISEYELLKEIKNYNILFKDLINITGIQKERLHRCLAYFVINNILEVGKFAERFKVEDELLKKFIFEIDSGKKIDEIARLDYWVDHRHFLAHRFHGDILNAVMINGSKKIFKIDNGENREKVKKIVEKLIEQDKLLTLDLICKELNICHETIRIWRCNEYISSMKKIQRQNKSKHLRDSQTKFECYKL